ncbi:hypothetical protein [Nocardia goodfellowii]|uniref:Uncharacterized protein n=1 Tax=Nocardia goodfellowii TaxID=882446 RepID=A0ABS4Q931_9NOCA|nr:hypothetical protein [Nocardia goodfellowii]MBP2187670.1 hypothetical protein [Nocardia goodfellowii]
MTVFEPRQSVVDTLLFGNLVIERTGSRVTTRLESGESTVVSIERVGPRTRKTVPIGTRKGNRIVARVDDREIKVTPGSGRLLKRTFRIAVEIDDRSLSFRPSTIDTVMFINGKPSEIEKHFCDLTAKANGEIDVAWALPQTVKILDRTIEPPVPTTEDLLIGYALAAAFGTGALSLTAIVAEMVALAIPG